MKNYTKKILIALTLIILLASLTSSFGVSSAYHKNKPLEMARGEIETVNFNLQNMVGEDDVFIIVSLITGHSIAKLEDTEFNVPIGTHDTYARLKVKIPEDATPGDVTKVKVDFNTVSPGTVGGIGLGTGMAFTFDVIVTGEPVAKTPVPWRPIVLIVGILVAGLIVVLVLRKRRLSIIENQRSLVGAPQ